MESDYNEDVAKPFVQKVQVLIPGPPDAPEIWTKSVDDNEFVIEWGQPRCYGVKIRGYQVGNIRKLCLTWTMKMVKALV